MPLSDDQRALLRLLAQREEGYEDIAALMGLSVGEVRARVRGALSALDEGGSSAGPVAGQGSSSSAGQGSSSLAAAGEPSPPPPAEDAPPVARPTPSATAEEAPLAARPARSATAEPRRPAAPRRRRSSGLAQDRRRLVELIGGAILVLLIVLFATGAVDIGGDDSGPDDSGPTALQGGALDAADGKLTQAVLEPVDGGDAEGQALFGRLGKQVVLQVLAQGLAPSATGESYAIWLYRSPKLALRVGAVKVTENGKLAARFPVPTELLALVASGSFRRVQVSRTADAAYKAEVAAAKGQQRLPRYTGETVLGGEIAGPLLKAAG